MHARASQPMHTFSRKEGFEESKSSSTFSSGEQEIVHPLSHQQQQQQPQQQKQQLVAVERDMVFNVDSEPAGGADDDAGTVQLHDSADIALDAAEHNKPYQ